MLIDTAGCDCEEAVGGLLADLCVTELFAALEASEGQLVDKLQYKEKRGSLLLQLGRFADAEGVYRELLKRNPDHYGYHAGLQASVLKSSAVIERWVHQELPDGAYLEGEAAVRAQSQRRSQATEARRASATRARSTCCCAATRAEVSSCTIAGRTRASARLRARWDGSREPCGGRPGGGVVGAGAPGRGPPRWGGAGGGARARARARPARPARPTHSVPSDLRILNVYMGAARTGSAIHSHSPAINILGVGVNGDARPMVPQSDVVKRFIELAEQTECPIGNAKYTAMLMCEGAGKTEPFKTIQTAKSYADLRAGAAACAKELQDASRQERGEDESNASDAAALAAAGSAPATRRMAGCVGDSRVSTLAAVAAALSERERESRAVLTRSAAARCRT